MLLSATGISKRFGVVQAIDAVDLRLAAGEAVGLAGENGSGKSTLILTIAGVHRSDSGTVSIDGTDLPNGDIRTARLHGVQLVTQEGSLHLDLSVAENIYLGRGLSRGRFGIDWRRTHQAARDAMRRFGLDIDPRLTVGELSKDQRQLVEITRAVSSDARVLLLDEPTSSLDHEEADRLFAVLRRLRQTGVGIVFVSHCMAELRQVCDRVAVLRDGHLVNEGGIDEIDEQWLLRQMAGRESNAPLRTPRVSEPKFSARSPEVKLTINDLRDHAGKVDGVSFSVQGGEVVALAGLVGAGRTERLEMIMGVRKRAAGSVQIDGHELGTTPSRTIRQGVALLPEDRRGKGLVETMTVHENICLRPAGLLRRRPMREQRMKASEWVERLRIHTSGVDAPITSLSGGNQQKVLLARCLATGPRILLLDEPTHGIDIRAKAEIAASIKDLAASGVAVLVASSELVEVLTVASRALVMRGGRIVAELAGAQLTKEAIIDHAVGREDHAHV